MRLDWRMLAMSLATLAVSACGSGAPTPGTDPIETVTRLYDPYIAEAANMPSLSNAAPWSDDLKPQLELAQQSEGGLGFDPIIDGQEYEIKDLNVVLEGEAGQSTATVRADFTNLGEPTTVLFDLERQDDGWRVRDVHTGEWALRGLLAAIPAPQGPPETTKQ
jgi:hypothetical protein